LLTGATRRSKTSPPASSTVGAATLPGKASYVCAERILPGWIVPNRVVCTVVGPWCSVTEVAFIVVFVSWWPRRMAAG
jgi:hypothetical protein